MQFCSTIVFMVAEVFFTLLVTIRSSVLHLCSWLMKFYSHYWLLICSSVLHYVHGCLRLFTLLVTIMQFCSTIVFMVVEITSYLLYGAVQLLVTNVTITSLTCFSVLLLLVLCVVGGCR